MALQQYKRLALPQQKQNNRKKSKCPQSKHATDQEVQWVHSTTKSKTKTKQKAEAWDDQRTHSHCSRKAKHTQRERERERSPTQ
ncbi:hypothetical protein TCDM_09559 [Trypanosoma cruzi Dm28c]|uniref:Uncharacterized protein n=1 Tax=Trypanosoma cruzi Dm28c TaxID=1416333 RepID=V5APQ7_TRYCR|nr:hypothetical protein TCDM_09559 [Trypanosoma cruzi Dm28c]